MSLLHDLIDSELLRTPQAIMLRLLTADGSGVTPAILARSLGVAKPTISMAISHMEKYGLVEQLVQARDKRVMKVYLTDTGRGRAETMLQALVSYVDDVKKREGRVHP